MKIALLTLVMTLWTGFPGDIGDKDNPPYRFGMELSVSPKTVYIGDVLFVKVNLINEGPKELIPESGETCPENSLFQYRLFDSKKNERILVWKSDFSLREQFMVPAQRNKSHTQESETTIKPKQKLKEHTFAVWFPPLHQIEEKGIASLRNDATFQKTGKQYTFECFVDPMILGTNAGYIDDYINNSVRLYALIENFNVVEPKANIAIQILPRPVEELDLIIRWFNQGPLLSDGISEELDGLDPLPLVVEGSPFLAGGKLKTREKGESIELGDAYLGFLDRITARNAESLARLEKSRELASQLLERAKQPDSTISTTMKEFIELRMLLLEIKYAKNDAAKNLWRTKAKTWLELAKDKEYWRKYLE